MSLQRAYALIPMGHEKRRYLTIGTKHSRRLIYKIGRISEEEHLRLDFQDGMSRTIEERIKFGLVPLKLPGIDDTAYRVFDTMGKYRSWCEETLLPYLGYWR